LPSTIRERTGTDGFRRKLPVGVKRTRYGCCRAGVRAGELFGNAGDETARFILPSRGQLLLRQRTAVSHVCGSQPIVVTECATGAAPVGLGLQQSGESVASRIIRIGRGAGWIATAKILLLQ